jgi:hypothetical protein
LPNQRLKKELGPWLPAYAAGTLGGWRRLAVKAWLKRDSAAREQLQQIQALRHDIRRQPQVQPAADVYRAIQSTIAQDAAPAPAGRPVRPAVAWVAAIVIALVALLLTWQALPPGISLEWSVRGEQPQAFRIYRAPITPDSPAPSQPFTLLDELPADEAAAAYRFTDWLPLPGQAYVYRVEALDQSGQPTASQTVLGRGIDALAGQLLTLAALGLLLASTILIIRRNIRSHPVYFQAV